MKAIVLFALFSSVAVGHKNLRSLTKLQQNNAILLNAHDNDNEDTDISIYTSDFFDKADEFKTLSEQKEDDQKKAKAIEKKKEQDELNAKNKIQNEIEDLKKQIKEKQSYNNNKGLKQPVPITEPEMNVDANELEEYTQQVTDKAENGEPEEAVIYANSAPRAKPEIPALDILDLDITSTDIKNVQIQHQYFVEDSMLLQIKEEESGMENVEIDGGDTDDAAIEETAVQTDAEASNLEIEQANAVEDISQNALKDIENGTEPPAEEVKTSPELNNFIETTNEDQDTQATEDDAPAAAASSQTQEQTDNIKAFGEKLGIEMPQSLFEVSDNESISAGLVEAAVNAGKSEDEIGAALAG